jgi:hypothetical protein
MRLCGLYSTTKQQIPFTTKPAGLPPPPPTFLQADRKVYAEPFVITPDAITALHPPALDFSTIGTDPFYDQTSGPRPAPQKNIRR